MAIDPSIPLGVQMPNFAGIYQNTMQARQQNMLAAKQQEEADFEKMQKNRLAQVYSQSVDPETGEVNQNALLKGLAGAGRGDLIPEIQTEFAQRNKALADAQKAQLEFNITNVANARQEIARATGRNDVIAVARKFVAAGALDADQANSIVSSIPDDPKGFAQWRSNFDMQLLDAEKRLDAQYKQGSLAVQRGQLGIAQQNVGLRGQELGLARQRLALDAIKTAQPQGPKPTYTEVRKQQQIDKGKGNVTKLVEKLGGYYSELEKRGGAVREGGGLANVPAYLGGTFGFREVPQALGTEASSTRTKITSARRALVQEIKNATGMSAQEMNSNAELQGLLDAATDPTQPLEAVRATLETLDQLYGTGAAGKAAPAPSTNIDALLEKYR
jgi:hypothetical protein